MLIQSLRRASAPLLSAACLIIGLSSSAFGQAAPTTFKFDLGTGPAAPGATKFSPI